MRVQRTEYPAPPSLPSPPLPPTQNPHPLRRGKRLEEMSRKIWNGKPGKDGNTRISYVCRSVLPVKDTIPNSLGGTEEGERGEVCPRRFSQRVLVQKNIQRIQTNFGFYIY